MIEALAGRWIVEAAELKGMRASEVELLKSFLSRRIDRARMSYDREVSEVPRQCVIIGTTNAAQYLKDDTGNRRFWPVKVKRFRPRRPAPGPRPALGRSRSTRGSGREPRPRRGPRPAAAQEQEQREVEDPYLAALDIVFRKLEGWVHS